MFRIQFRDSFDKGEQIKRLWCIARFVGYSFFGYLNSLMTLFGNLCGEIHLNNRELICHCSSEESCLNNRFSA